MHPTRVRQVRTFQPVPVATCDEASGPSGPWLIASNEPEEVTLTPLDPAKTLYRGHAVLGGGGIASPSASAYFSCT